MKKSLEKIDFGFKQVNINKKEKLVNNIFDSVSSKYDLMNDLSSLGLHRLWKQELINWIAPQSNQSLLDIAGGTGDIAKLFIKSGGNSADIIDINYNMLINGISNDNRIRYIVGNCERLPIKNNVYDRITIAFGLRNITNRQLALDEIYRVLKPGGKVYIEMPAPDNHRPLEYIANHYSIMGPKQWAALMLRHKLQILVATDFKIELFDNKQPDKKFEENN